MQFTDLHIGYSGVEKKASESQTRGRAITTTLFRDVKGEKDTGSVILT